MRKDTSRIKSKRSAINPTSNSVLQSDVIIEQAGHSQVEDCEVSSKNTVPKDLSSKEVHLAIDEAQSSARRETGKFLSVKETRETMSTNVLEAENPL